MITVTSPTRSRRGWPLGMTMAIPLTAFGVVFWRLAKENYIQEWV